MNNKFDELARGLAQSVTRRAALKKFGVGIAGLALAALGLARNAEARPNGSRCHAWGCFEGVIYICGGKKVKSGCVDTGIVDCSYCGYKCC